MNKTQKGAWFTLLMSVLLIIFLGYILLAMFTSGEPPKTFVKFWSLLVLGLMVFSLVWLRIKQSPAEVDSDERDDLIKKRAVTASFVSVWILLIVSTIATMSIVGDNGSVTVYLLPILNFGVFLGVGLVYSVAILTQYGWGGKDGEK